MTSTSTSTRSRWPVPAVRESGHGHTGEPACVWRGANLAITGSGWDSTWNTNLAANTAALRTALKCDATYQTWTDTAGSNESKPVNCLDWYTAFAFCAWDGGRLATEAEWNYAASGETSSGTIRGQARQHLRQSMTVTRSTVAAHVAAHRTSVQSLRKATGNGDSPTWPGTCGMDVGLVCRPIPNAMR